MKTFVFIGLFLATASASAASTEPWLTAWPANVRPNSGHEIVAQNVVEIPHSLFESAEELLKDKAILHIGNDYFPGFRYSCHGSTRAFLVRALYEHGANGTFLVRSVGRALLIRHYTLGSASTLHRSALVVCLGFSPNQVYVATGGAM